MKYPGSKRRYAKEILLAILHDIRAQGKEIPSCWVEPFVGGANIIDRAGGYFPQRIGSDINGHLIYFYKAIQAGWIPPEALSQEEWTIWKEKSNKPPSIQESPMIAFAGIPCSYMGRWFTSYAHPNERSKSYSREGRNSILKQKPDLMGIDFIHSDYKDLLLPEGSIIYCDPPYRGSRVFADRKLPDDFYNEFWSFCENKIRLGHQVYISEYSSPDGWECIWSKEVISAFRGPETRLRVEKLFTKRLK